jgi:hypothetical protein
MESSSVVGFRIVILVCPFPEGSGAAFTSRSLERCDERLENRREPTFYLFVIDSGFSGSFRCVLYRRA